MNKKCHDCGRELPVDQFNKNKARKDGFQSRCRECDKKRAIENYYKYREKSIARTKKRRKDLVKWFIEIRQQYKCEKCGEERWYVLDFHHKDSQAKTGEVADLVARSFSKKRISEEISKCSVLCANCHREEHYLIRMNA